MLKSLRVTNLLRNASLHNKTLIKQFGKYFSFSELEILRTKIDKNSQAFKVKFIKLNLTNSKKG